MPSPPDDPGRTAPGRPPAPGPGGDAPAPPDAIADDLKRTAARTPDLPSVGGDALGTQPDGRAPTLAAPPPAPTDLVPGYRIERELGRGGMGVVYRARHLQLNRVVALKLLLGGARSTGADLTRFLAEAQAVAAIRHPNVVQVFDYGEAGGKPYMALEFCAGGSLAARLAQRHGPVRSPGQARKAAALVAQVARGVAAAHARGIVHRDLKPDNVLLDEGRVPKVADFGLAKRGAGADVTRTGEVVGTPAYMSPEQARGEAKSAGPPADVWALGVILYECLTGRNLFDGTVQEVLAQIVRAEAPGPRASAPAVPRDLDRICLKCLAKGPHERYPTAKEFADDLDRLLNNEPIRARPAGAQARAVTADAPRADAPSADAPPRLAVWAGAGMGALAVVVLVVVLVAGKNKPDPGAAPAAKTLGVTEPSQAEREAAKREAEKNEIARLANERETARLANERKRLQAEEDFKRGENFYSGINGAPLDYAKAREWYELAGTQGHAGAQYTLGQMYAAGRGAVRDDAKAREWYEKAAAQNHASAQNNLGVVYYSGRGVSQDYAKAREWYEKAAAQNHATAQSNLGSLYYNGSGVPRDYTKAREWYEKAANQNHAPAQRSLGLIYELGRDVPPNLTTALTWYRKAAALGDEEAKKAVARLERGK